MRDVFAQYAGIVETRRQKVRETSGGEEPDMRIGWLLWQDTLREFLYFEYPMVAPNPDEYWAEWTDRTKSNSRRKGSKNLWIYHKETKQKRYSVTTEAGIKIQPYFDVPPPNDPNLYLFTVQGELDVEPNLVRLWLTIPTAQELERIVGGLDPELLSKTIIEAAAGIEAIADHGVAIDAEARPIFVTTEAYSALVEAFDGVSDEQRVQLLNAYLRDHPIGR